MKKLKKTILFVILLMIPICLIDFYVDAYASLRLTYRKIGILGIESNYCTGTDIPLSERKPKWAKLIIMTPVDNMILGSSRSMVFSSDNLEISSFYNLSVSAGCTMEDYYAETYVLTKSDRLPQNLLIEVSPSLFNRNNGFTNWTEWGDSEIYMRNLLENDVSEGDDSYLLGIQLGDLFSPGYFKYNCEQMLEGNRTMVRANSLYDDETLPTQHIDGSYAYSREYQSKNGVDQIEQGIEKICDNHSIYHCDNFKCMDATLVEDFEELITYMREQGINISFYLPPYSEYMYDYICNDEYYHSILDVEDYILEYARENNIQVYGSYNPENSHLQLSDQYDEYHIRSEKIRDTLWVRFDDLDNVWNEQTEDY